LTDDHFSQEWGAGNFGGVGSLMQFITLEKWKVQW
jgi:hypothetical protein